MADLIIPFTLSEFWKQEATRHKVVLASPVGLTCSERLKGLVLLCQKSSQKISNSIACRLPERLGPIHH